MTYPMSSTCQFKNINEFYNKYFGEKKDGVFVEVGAHDGYSFSLTWGLAEAGWKGIYFEPVKELYERCVKRHEKNSVKVLNLAIGNKIGKTKLYLGANPTINEETVERSPWDFKYDPTNFIEVDVSTLDVELDKQAEFFDSIDLLVIDVEGGELEVLEGFDIFGFLPKMIIIETCEGNVDKRKSFHTEAILSYFDGTPYTKIYSNGQDTVWVYNSLI